MIYIFGTNAILSIYYSQNCLVLLDIVVNTYNENNECIHLLLIMSVNIIDCLN